MAIYLLRRILLFIPTLIIISLLAFIISINAPGDPVERLISTAETGDMSGPPRALREQRAYWTERLGLNLPVFYISMTPLSYPDTLYRVTDKEERKALKHLLQQYGNREAISAYHQSLKALHASHNNIVIPDSLKAQFGTINWRDVFYQSQFTVLSLFTLSDSAAINLAMRELIALYREYSFFKVQQSLLQGVIKDYHEMISSTEKWKNLLPSFHFYPVNQYHRWLFGDGNWLTGKGSTFSKGLIRGDLGISYITKMPVTTIISDRIGWSLFFTLASLLLACLISLPIGIEAALKHGGVFDRTSTVVLFILYSMPAFWVATLLLIIFANPDVLHWFPSSGVKPATGYPENAGFSEKFRLSLPYLILPLIAYTYSSLAFLSRIMRVATLEVINQDFIRTARAKGLPERMVVYKHTVRNALLPIITVFANIFPAAIGGSVILETIFTIPGMGLETYLAIQTLNYPMIIGVFTLTGVLTLLGYLIADVLYAVADPRISLTSKR